MLPSGIKKFSVSMHDSNWSGVKIRACLLCHAIKSTMGLQPFRRSIKSILLSFFDLFFAHNQTATQDSNPVEPFEVVEVK